MVPLQTGAITDRYNMRQIDPYKLELMLIISICNFILYTSTYIYIYIYIYTYAL